MVFSEEHKNARAWDESKPSALRTFLFSENPNPKKRMVQARIIQSRTIERDNRAMSFASMLQERLSDTDGIYMLYYAEFLMYTQSLAFNIPKKAEPHYGSLREWWRMVCEEDDDIECYTYFRENINMVISTEWRNAQKDAQKIWKPSDEDWFDEDESENEETDPN